MASSPRQDKLLDTAIQLPNGLIYKPNFITPEEEAYIISHLELLPLEEARVREYTARRRHFNFGWGYDFEKRKFIKGPPLPPFLKRLQIRIAKWLDISPKRVVEALVNEYSPKSAIGWHNDGEEFEHIVGISLLGRAEMKFRPARPKNQKKNPKDIITLELEPRSAYLMQKEVRYKWLHSVAKTKELRYSITFRTLPKGISFK